MKIIEKIKKALHNYYFLSSLYVILCFVFGVFIAIEFYKANHISIDKQVYVGVCHIGDDTLQLSIKDWEVNDSSLTIIDNKDTVLITGINNCYIVGTNGIAINFNQI